MHLICIAGDTSLTRLVAALQTKKKKKGEEANISSEDKPGALSSRPESLFSPRRTLERVTGSVNRNLPPPPARSSLPLIASPLFIALWGLRGLLTSPETAGVPAARLNQESYRSINHRTGVTRLSPARPYRCAYVLRVLGMSQRHGRWLSIVLRTELQ